MIKNLEDLAELMDKIQVAHRYNETSVRFKGQVLNVKYAEALVARFTKDGGKHGSKQ